MIRALLLAALMFTAQATSAAAPATALPKVKLDVAGHAISVEVAATPPTRETGLMNRFSIPPDEGMIFVFRMPQPQAFWMRNTFMPLSIAFIDADGRILNIEDMAPRTDDTHLSQGLALYALEMRQGWFKRNGIGPGARVTGLPKPSSE